MKFWYTFLFHRLHMLYILNLWNYHITVLYLILWYWNTWLIGLHVWSKWCWNSDLFILIDLSKNVTCNVVSPIKIKGLKVTFSLSSMYPIVNFNGSHNLPRGQFFGTGGSINSFRQLILFRNLLRHARFLNISIIKLVNFQNFNGLTFCNTKTEV